MLPAHEIVIAERDGASRVDRLPFVGNEGAAERRTVGVIGLHLELWVTFSIGKYGCGRAGKREASVGENRYVLKVVVGEERHVQGWAEADRGIRPRGLWDGVDYATCCHRSQQQARE